jgi:hypothetical protein
MAAGGTSTNVQTGPGRLYVAPIGTTEPVSSSAALPSAWIPIGYTEQGHEYVADITSEAIEVAEELDPIRYENTRRVSRVTFSMAEATKRRLAIALGSGAATADDAVAYEPPDPGAELAVMLVWDSDEDPTTNTNVRWIYRQAKPSGSVTVAHGKAPAKALIPVTFNLEKPTGLKPIKVFPNASGHIA